MVSTPIARWFSDIRKEDIAEVGGKGANLGELTRAGIPVPPGFVVTTRAYIEFLEHNALADDIARRLEGIDTADPQSLAAASAEIQSIITAAPVSQATADQIRDSYDRLGGGPVAVRSSATAEDLATASFAGQQATLLNVVGSDAVLDAVRRCWASLFEPQAIAYRTRNGVDHASVAIAVPVQSMVQAGRSGVMFTVNPVTGSSDQIVVEAVYGLGEALVSGVVTPDMYIVDKATGAIIECAPAEQDQALTLAAGGSGTEWQPVPADLRQAPKLTDEEVAALARMGLRIEAHYGSPQDIEWAMKDGDIYILQSRPITTA
jgi:pyruvate,water dikinase